VVVDNLDLVWPPRRPDKTDAILIVNANAILPRPVTSERFQPVSWRDPEIRQLPSGSKIGQFALRHTPHVEWEETSCRAGLCVIEDIGRALILEADDHRMGLG
jgi:hypothetical protein